MVSVRFLMPKLSTGAIPPLPTLVPPSHYKSPAQANLLLCHFDDPRLPAHAAYTRDSRLYAILPGAYTTLEVAAGALARV